MDIELVFFVGFKDFANFKAYHPRIVNDQYFYFHIVCFLFKMRRLKPNATKLSYKSLHKNDFRSVGVSVGVAVAVVVARKRRRKISLTPTRTNTATTTGHVYVYGKYVMPMIYTFS